MKLRRAARATLPPLLLPEEPLPLLEELLEQPLLDIVILFLGVGVLGGFTTFSAFSLEMAQMVQRGQGMMAAAYAAVSVILALGAVFAGMMLARTIWT